MKIVSVAAGILIVAASLFLAKGLSDGYSEKIRFLSETYEFIEYAQGEIDFYNSEFDIVVDKYIEKKGCSRLTELLRGEEPTGKGTELTEYIDGIKKLDKEAQKTFSKAFSEKIKRELEKAEAEEAKKAGLLKKLIPLVGIAVFIIIL